MQKSRGISPVIATIILIGVFIAVVAAALMVSRSEIEAGYAKADVSQASSVCASVGQAVQSAGFSFGASESEGYTFRTTAVGFVPDAFWYTLEVGSQEIEYNSGLLVFSTYSPDFSLGAGYHLEVYPENGFQEVSGLAARPESAVFCSQAENVSSAGNYFETGVFGLPELVNMNQTVDGEAFWRLYVLRFVGEQPGVERFASSGFVSVEGKGENITGYAGVSALSLKVVGEQGGYAPSEFFQDSASFEFGSPVYLQVVFATVSVGGSLVAG